jgi:hypothetical protein
MKCISFGLALALLAGPAVAADPVALVEDIAAKGAGVEFMDYVAAGRVIPLGAGGSLVLSYLRSCVRETVTGGTVTVGIDQSKVAGGKVSREVVSCDGGKLALTTEQSAKSGTMVFRKAPTAATLPPPAIVLYGTAPVIDVPGGGNLVIERLDQPGERLTLQIGGQQLLRGSFYDMAKTDHALAPGGLYRASIDSRQIVFRVDGNAHAGRGPVIGRLLRLPAA